MIAAVALANATARLKAAQVPDAANDARILLAYVLNIDRSRLLLVLPDEISPEMAHSYEKTITARCSRQPVSQITKTRGFYGRDFIVSPQVLDPRPDTELLIDTALGTPFETVLDLGTGSGCILLTLVAENPVANGVGADISDAALDIANQNAAVLGLQDKCVFQSSNWFDEIQGQFDLIISNPPYISAVEMQGLAPEVRNWEPELALTPGGDGLDAYRIISAVAKDFLTSDGRLIVEIGTTQGGAVTALFENCGYNGITVMQDMNGHDRLVLARPS